MFEFFRILVFFRVNAINFDLARDLRLGAVRVLVYGGSYVFGFYYFF